jgi:hypothetical protein
LSQPRQRLVDGDAADPRRPARVALELVEVQERLYVRLLDDVLDLGRVAQHGAHHAKDALVVPAHQQLEGGGVVRAGALDEHLIGRVGLLRQQRDGISPGCGFAGHGELLFFRAMHFYRATRVAEVTRFRRPQANRE